MTREEAILYLEKMKMVPSENWNELWKEVAKKRNQVIDMAIEALQVKIDGGLISRAGVSAWLSNMGHDKLSSVVMDTRRFPPECAKGGDAEIPSTEQYPYMQQSRHDDGKDLISRQDAINTSLEFFVEFLGGAFHENDQKELIARIYRISSAEPKTKCVAQIKVDTEDIVKRIKEGYELADRVDCTDFIGWLTEKVMEKENWKLNCEAYGEIIARKLEKLGVVKVVDGYYIIADDTDRPSGKWIMHIDNLYPEDSTQECSNCHEHETIRIYNDNYCPNCGADMRGENNADND